MSQLEYARDLGLTISLTKAAKYICWTRNGLYKLFHSETDREHNKYKRLILKAQALWEADPNGN